MPPRAWPPGQPAPAARGARGTTPSFRAQRARGGRGEERRLRPGRSRRRPTARRAGRSAATARRCTADQVRPTEQHAAIDALADTYVATAPRSRSCGSTSSHRSTAPTRRSSTQRGALDFGEQIAAVTQLFKDRPNVLRRWQRQFRYILVDEFQDANIAQIELIELLGRTPDRPDNVMVVGDDDQSIYRFRGASFAAFAEFDRRFSRPPAHDPDGPAPGRRRACGSSENFRSVGARPDGRQPADRPQRDPLRAGQAAPDRAPGRRPDRAASSCARAPRTRRSRSWTPSASALGDDATPVVGRRGPVPQAQAPRGDRRPAARRGHPVHRGRRAVAVRDAEIRDLEQSLRAIADPHEDVALIRMMTAGPWRLDALEILHVAPDGPLRHGVST